MNYIKKNMKGITLISLVITIILLLILAGISIRSIVGSNGILKTAQKATKDYENDQIDEKEYIDSLEDDTEENTENLPENTPENPQEVGKRVALKEEWKSEKKSTVYAVSIGDGETIPVPKRFFYVGGNFRTGVIISDNEQDKYEEGKDKTTYEYTTKLKGNQFVWIPCTETEYKKCDSWNGTTQTDTILGDCVWDKNTPDSELVQIKKYGGFYIARYEAGLANTIKEFTTNQKHTSLNSVYNKDGVPQSKAGMVPWMYIDWTQSKANAEKMYNNIYVNSGLVTGTQWDVILNKMLSENAIKASDLTASENLGNYANNEIQYTGRLAKADYNITNSNAWTLKPFGTITTGQTSSYSKNNGDLLTTGASDIAQRYHIFDFAGNLWEWTDEEDIYKNNTNKQYRITRGGSYNNLSNNMCVCYRAGSGVVDYTGFSTRISCGTLY